MAFWNKEELDKAMDWFKANPNSVPTPELINTFTDDHILCAEVDFGGMFKHTFWCIGGEGLWKLAQSDVAMIKEDMANGMEDIVFEGTCKFEGTDAYVTLDEALVAKCKEFFAPYAPKED